MFGLQISTGWWTFPSCPWGGGRTCSSISSLLAVHILCSEHGNITCLKVQGSIKETVPHTNKYVFSIFFSWKKKKKKNGFFVIFAVQILDDEARFDKICRILMQFYAMKLRNLQKLWELVIWWIRKSDSPSTTNLNLKSHVMISDECIFLRRNLCGLKCTLWLIMWSHNRVFLEGVFMSYNKPMETFCSEELN